jgi:isocitrate/isopropylmalate dehydrogenase
MISTTEMLKDVREEIARLQRLEAALIEAAGGSAPSAPHKKSRISAEGAAIISLAAKLRHLRKSGDKRAIKQAEKELELAKKAKARMKA